MKLFLILITFFTFSINTYAGIQTNGGDGIAAEFLSIFDNTIHEISQLSENLDESSYGKIIRDLKERRNIVEIQTSPSLSLNNTPKDAINFPTLNPPLIKISQSSWVRLTSYQKTLLVIHEMLPVSGYFDGDYKLSSSMISMTTIAHNRTKVIVEAFSTCNSSKLKTIDDHELKRLSEERTLMLAHLTTKNLCTDGLRLLIEAGWDINLCPRGSSDTLEVTPLAYLTIFFPRGFREHFPQFNELHKLLVDNGATNKCSGFYQKEQ